uniref:IP12648p n=1 Tax=Drosophila melanogaster TaxID=7227 RepID=Q058X6_DROME|nr:IP12648p [Drosophila melanogaster]
MASRQMALTRVMATSQDPLLPFCPPSGPAFAFLDAFPFALPVAPAPVVEPSDVGDLASRPTISPPTTTPPARGLPKFTFDFWMLAISPPESLFEIEFWRDSVRRMFECSVTSGNPPKPVVW